MTDYPQSDDKRDIEELLAQYESFRRGQAAGYIDEEAFEKLIIYFESKEQYKRAMQAVDLAIEQFQYSGTLLVKKADLLLNNRAYSEALEILERSSIFDNSNINLYILKTEALLALDRQEEAADLLEQALHFFNGEEKIDLLFELADVYDDYENFDKVFDCLKLILEMEPANEEALYKICFWTDFTGRNAEAITLYQKIIEESPYCELAWFNLGAAYQGLKLYEKAIDAYQYALVIDEKLDYAYRNMGDAYIRLRKYKEAIESLEKVLELSKPEDVIYEAMGHCYERLKKYALARFYYKKASHLNQEDAVLFYKMAFTYYKELKYVESIKQLEMALKLKRKKPEFYLLMGDCKIQLGFIKEAVQYFAAAVALRPKSLLTREALIKALYIAGDFGQALLQVEKAYKLLGPKPVFNIYKTAILIADGKMKQALVCLEESLSNDPKLLKKLISFNPSILKYSQVSDLIIKYKKRPGKK